MQSIIGLNIQAYGPFDFKSLGAQYAKIKNSTQTGEYQLEDIGFNCVTPPKPKFRLSTGDKVGSGIGAAIIGLALLMLLIWKVKRSKAKKANKLPSYLLASLDPAPKYPDASISEEGAENGSRVTPAGAYEEPQVDFQSPTYDAPLAQPGENEGRRENEMRTDQHNDI